MRISTNNDKTPPLFILPNLMQRIHLNLYLNSPSSLIIVVVFFFFITVGHVLGLNMEQYEEE